MKTVNETLSKVKGSDKVNDILTGKGSFSQAGFSDLVNAMVNDTTFKVTTYGKDGKANGELSISEMIRDDLKKTLDKAKYPQKSEADVLNNCEIVTNGLAKAIPQIVMQQLACGKKFDLPTQEKMVGSIYLANNPGKVKDVQIRDPKTQENLGTATITTQDSIQVRVKSPVPQHLSTKVRKDVNGKVVNQ